jgi:exonuclease VII small subunit
VSEAVERLETAERRLDDALARFETALAAAAGRPTMQAVAGGALKAECDKLAQALKEARTKNEELKAMSNDAAVRLDEAIAQIDLLLED